MTDSLRFFRAVTAFIYLMATVGALAGMGLFCLFLVAVKDLPQVPEPIGRINDTPATEIFSADGQRILTIGGRETVALDDVSYPFIQAMLATEDHRFWEHRGVNKLRTVKALWVTLFESGKIQGASTITQQLAKNLFFSFERTWVRKFRELLVALQIEAQFSKQEILEAYINQIPFGVGAYGIGEAARTFFGKPAGGLTLAEASLLAGLPKSPTRYNPFRYPERARARQQVVLQRMVTTGMISREEAIEAQAVSVDLRAQGRSLRVDSYFLDAVMKSLEETYSPEVVYHGGLRVYTTLDAGMQQQAETALQQGIAKLEAQMDMTHRSEETRVEDDNGLQGALVAVEVNTGAVKALVGGRDFFQTPYNRAVQDNRQPGSGFKPFLYYGVLENLDKTPADVMVDQPVSIPVAGKAPWKPRNFKRTYEGAMVLKKAFTASVNTVAAQLVSTVGPDAVINIARRCGITSHLAPVYSVALGTFGVSPLEMAAAYATFASGGVRHPPYWIRRVEDVSGRVLQEHIITGERVLNESINFQLVDMMAGVIDDGTGNGVRRMGFALPAAGKTGTTNDYNDAWFTGFTPNLSTSVWVGFDRGQGMRDKNGAGITGGRGAAPIWAQFMKQATEGEPPRAFVAPPDIYFKKVNPETGSLAGFWTRDPVTVAMRKKHS
ncbi:PBP1A family penicillin-binding protein [Desulfosarcina sp.]|uniref:transglycosylase domain-containing protein n=1 Tax=Desulfosarcina sp. TaxID=2027861 RepID=UPI0029B35F02|nr:PBP1A family penicillin-binding protein [Desulfosarcina sp.]MDX2454046.1 PBP1A family penicillin-binding protein [Desulfosarcina sp.]MDX2491733.1 PBP1A family penicillin-binding protein [Desulfosarcina sp.]